MSVMTSKAFVEKAIDIAKNYKTLYVMGCFGAPMTAANKTRYCNNHNYNKAAARTAMINAASADTFGFDCVCLIKGILWGWCGDTSKTYGGAGYAVNGVPDIGADTMITKCTEVSTTGWDKMVPGEVVWLSGHIGIYIGDGLAVECTPAWENQVQITAVGNIGSKTGYNKRTWTKHGKLPYLDYSDQKASVGSTVTAAQGTAADTKTIWDFLMGKIGNPYGVAGLMGNLYAESGLIPNNLQNSYNTKFGMTDKEYTDAVDNGSYTNFVKDSGGYGLAQWTYYTRKQALLDYARSKNASIGNLAMQLEFLYKELSESFPSVLTTLKNAESVLEASNAVLTKFERPADQGTAVQTKRAGYGETYLKQYVTLTTDTTDNTEKEETEMRYNKIADIPAYAQPTIIKMVDKGIIGGTGTGAKDENNRPVDLDLSIDMIRVFVTNDRAGVYGD